MTRAPNHVPHSASSPISLAERIEWKRLEVEEAVQRLAKDKYRGKAFVEAAIARHAELVQLRALAGEHPGRGQHAYHPSHRKVG